MWSLLYRLPVLRRRGTDVRRRRRMLRASREATTARGDVAWSGPKGWASCLRVASKRTSSSSLSSCVQAFSERRSPVVASGPRGAAENGRSARRRSPASEAMHWGRRRATAAYLGGTVKPCTSCAG